MTKALQSSESNEWYTPTQFIESARAVMGSINLDPASCEIANQTIKADKFYSIEDDGFNQQWFGNVWLNPPYGRFNGKSNQQLWSAKLIEKYKRGEIAQAVLLVNAVTDTQWFYPLWEYPICFTRSRIKFYNANGLSKQPTHGNAFIYFGRNIDAFADKFIKHGVIVSNVRLST